MRYFKANGLWSTSADAKHMIAGTLRFSPFGLRLTLIGNFGSGWSPRAGKSYPIIQGVVGSSPFGRFATLYDCLTTKTTLNSSAVGSETIRCRKAIIGDDHPPSQETEYTSLDIGLTYLDEWVGWRNIQTAWEPSEKREFVIRYHEPEMITCPIGHATIKIYSAMALAHSLEYARIREEARLLIEPLGKVAAERAGDAYLHRLQNLLTFATDIPNEIESTLMRGELVDYGSSKLPKSYFLIRSPVLKGRGPKKWRTPDEMLFSLNDARDAGLNIFRNWLELVERHEEYVNFYFAELYFPSTIVEDRFRNVVVAFLLYCRTNSGVSDRATRFLTAFDSALKAAVDPDEQVWLQRAVPDEASIEMPFRLLALLDENRAIMERIVDCGFKEFVDLVCRTFDSVTRRSTVNGGPVFQGPDLYYATEKIRWLLKVLMLRELGFGEERVKSLVERNTSFNFLRATATTGPRALA
jgi:ApeA N-terminal domain 1